MASKKLLIVDVDAMLGLRNTLGNPSCLRSTCNKGESSLSERGKCLRGRWCENSSYDPKSILEYRSESNVTSDNCYSAVLPALEKMALSGWLVSFWTTRPKKQTFRIIKTLREVGIWKTAQTLSGTPLLLNSSELPDNGNFSPATEKLTLFERVYGKLSDDEWSLAAIEADPLEANILQSYTGSRVTVHISPRIWLEILMMERDGIYGLLRSSSRESGTVTVDRAG
jgi:hypothetical protein